MRIPEIMAPGGKLLRINDGRLVRFWYTQFDTDEVRAYVKRKQVGANDPIATIPDERRGKTTRLRLRQRV